ncbi:MAG TPA: alpha-L-arabinofuranosidase C-terminal domain-containing protein, partial [Acidobacteriota bacterium]|nr:alpha-L-arabinofuranosidase C-terminal domain-containing protein [Acidobacteriota bacterium]
NDTSRYLALNLDMERQIHQIAAVCDYVGGLMRSRKRLWLSFDEWNVWYRARSGDDVNGRGRFAPPLLEEPYNLEDALLVGGFLNTLMRESARVRIACLAQLVNVIAPIMTNESGLLKQTIYYPYVWALQYAYPQVLDILVESETYPIQGRGFRPESAPNEEVPYVDAVVTMDASTGRVSVFVLNRDLGQERELELNWDGLTPTQVLHCETLTG